MDSEVCTIVVKSEEVEIIDVAVDQGENYQDNKSSVIFDGSEFDSNETNVRKELSTVNEEDDSFNSDKADIDCEEEGSNVKQVVNEAVGGFNVSGEERSTPANETRDACTSNGTLNKKRSLGTNKNSLRKSADCSYKRSMRVKGNMVGGKEVSCNKNRSGKPKAKQEESINSFNNENMENRNNSEMSVASKQSVISTDHDNCISKDSSDAEGALYNEPAIGEPISCPYCNFQTRLPSLLAIHKRRHKIKKAWQCDECNYSSAYKFSLQRHVMLVHEKPLNIYCSECDFRCSRDIQLKNHMLEHTESQYFQCSECDYKHVKQAVLRRHMVRHAENKFHLMCPDCGYKGVKPEYLVRHIRKHHRSSELAKENVDTNISDHSRIIQKQPVVLLKRCDDAKEYKSSRVNMGVIHQQILQDNFFEVAKSGKTEDISDSESPSVIHVEDDSSVVLKSSIITKRNNFITSIVKMVDNVKPLQLQLDISKYENQVKEDIKRQLETKRGGTTTTPAKPKLVMVNEVVYNKNDSSKTTDVYQCNECSFVSMWFDRFEAHVKLHGEGCFFCEKCDFIAKSQISLGRHMRLKHAKSKDFECPKCDYRCSTSNQLSDHIKCHRKVKVYECDKCKVTCKSANALKHHMSKHDRLKPFACELCDFRTRFKTSLRNHMFVHTGETKFVCEICNYKFYAKACLKKHMEVHTSSK